jgi:hypothetical protein
MGKVNTTDREIDLCPRCRKKLEENGQPLVAHPRIPWSER